MHPYKRKRAASTGDTEGETGDGEGEMSGCVTASRAHVLICRSSAQPPVLVKLKVSWAGLMQFRSSTPTVYFQTVLTPLPIQESLGWDPEPTFGRGNTQMPLERTTEQKYIWAN